LRKDFPTSGFLEVRYDEVEKRVVYEPTTLTQGYRDFDFLSPWDNPEVYTNLDAKDKN
jgi:NADH-quinone oxidoreductase subunit C